MSRLEEMLQKLVITAVVIGLWATYSDVQAMKIREPYNKEALIELQKIVKELKEVTEELKKAQAVTDAVISK